MEHIVDVLMSVWDQPAFQHISGIITGMAVIGALWAICGGYRQQKYIKELMRLIEEKDEGRDNDEA